MSLDKVLIVPGIQDGADEDVVLDGLCEPEQEGRQAVRGGKHPKKGRCRVSASAIEREAIILIHPIVEIHLLAGPRGENIDGKGGVPGGSSSWEDHPRVLLLCRVRRGMSCDDDEDDDGE
jgi:hypothetical protein